MTVWATAARAGANLAADAQLAREIASEAGDLLRDILSTATCSATELGKRGDAEANALILDRLRAARPDDHILSEESHDDRVRCGARRVWIVDPLDGTRDYSDRLGDYAVHIGLAIDGVPPAVQRAPHVARHRPASKIHFEWEFHRKIRQISQ